MSKRPPPSEDYVAMGGKKRAAAASPDKGDKKRPAVFPPTAEEDKCWICLDASHASGEPLRRDCSCRRDWGWVHFPCLVNFAIQKTRQWVNEEDPDFPLTAPWAVCPKCKRLYQNELALDLASEFVSLAEEKYEQLLQLEALELKLIVLMGIITRRPHLMQTPLMYEVKEVAIKIFSMIDLMKAENTSPTNYILQIEAHAYNQLGHIALREGTTDGVRRAMGYFEKGRDIFNSIDDAEQAADAERNLALAMSEYEGQHTSEARILFTKLAAVRQENMATVYEGVNLGIELKDAHCGIEAERLLSKLVAVSKHDFGPDHEITREAESNLQQCKERYVVLASDVEADYPGGRKLFQALRYEKDGKKCVVKGPIIIPRNTREEETLTVNTADLRYQLGTPVICHGLVEDTLYHLNGKIADLRSWDEETSCFILRFEDEDLQPCSVKPNKIRILFDLDGGDQEGPSTDVLTDRGDALEKAKQALLQNLMRAGGVGGEGEGGPKQRPMMADGRQEQRSPIPGAITTSASVSTKSR